MVYQGQTPNLHNFVPARWVSTGFSEPSAHVATHALFPQSTLVDVQAVLSPEQFTVQGPSSEHLMTKALQHLEFRYRIGI